MVRTCAKLRVELADSIPCISVVEQDKALSEYNYRGWKKLRDMEVSLNQRLMFDSVWGKQGRVIVISNDAEGCYDCITHMIVAYMCMQ